MPILCDKCKKQIKSKKDLIELIFLWVFPKKFHIDCYLQFNRKPIRLLYSGWPVNSKIYTATLIAIFLVALVFDYVFFTYFKFVYNSYFMPEQFKLFFFFMLVLINLLIFFHVFMRFYFYYTIEKKLAK